MVVGPQHKADILHRNDGGERPKENGQNTVNVFRCEFHMPRSEDLFHGIQNTGTDVAVDHADRADGQGG